MGCYYGGGAMVAKGKSRLNVRADILRPEPIQVRQYLSRWDKDEKTVTQEAVVQKFFKLYPDNDNLEDVLVKATLLNVFYSTGIIDIYTMAKHIVVLQIDERLRAGDESVVSEIRRVTVGNPAKVMNFYSFASKYCSHHNPQQYPIFDSYVAAVLTYFRKLHGFTELFNVVDDIKIDYVKFKQVVSEFKTFYGLEEFSYKEIDQYLWGLGRDKFPNT